jgi:hypothetical protein
MVISGHPPPSPLGSQRMGKKLQIFKSTSVTKNVEKEGFYNNCKFYYSWGRNSAPGVGPNLAYSIDV